MAILPNDRTVFKCIALAGCLATSGCSSKAKPRTAVGKPVPVASEESGSDKSGGPSGSPESGGPVESAPAAEPNTVSVKAVVEAPPGTFARPAFATITDEPVAAGIAAVVGSEVLAVATLVTTDESGKLLTSAEVAGNLSVAFQGVDADIDRSSLTVVVVTGRGSPGETRTRIPNGQLVFVDEPDGTLTVRFVTREPNATFELQRLPSAQAVLGIVSPRRHFQTRSVVTLELAADFAEAGDEVVLKNLTTAALLSGTSGNLGPEAYDGSGSFVHFGPGLRYGDNVLELRAETKDGIKTASVEATLRDFTIMAPQLASFGETAPPWFQAWTTPIMPSSVQGSASGRTLSTQALRIIHE